MRIYLQHGSTKELELGVAVDSEVVGAQTRFFYRGKVRRTRSPARPMAHNLLALTVSRLQDTTMQQLHCTKEIQK